MSQHENERTRGDTPDTPEDAARQRAQAADDQGQSRRDSTPRDRRTPPDETS